MDSVVSLLTEIGGWLTSAGLFGLFLTLAFREWSSWRTRIRERKALLYLVGREVNENETTLGTMLDSPATVTRVPVETLQSKVWEDSRVRLAQLIRDKDEFRDIAIYYQNVNIVINMMRNPTMSDTDKGSLIPMAADSTKQMGHEAKEIVGKYGELPESTYNVIVPLRDEAR